MSKDKPVILTINRNRRNLELLAEHLGKEGYQVFGVDSYELFDRALDDDTVGIDAALVDIVGFDTHIWLRCERLRDCNVPFMVISPKLSVAIQQESLSHGARVVMIKPLVIKEFVKIMQRLLEEE